MTQIVFPKTIISILSRLENAGYSAYAVGGCIRDALLGRTPDDWDLTTSAAPEEVMRLFGPAALPTGLKHGTVTVREDGLCAEVTTFRADGEYADHRRPSSVHFVHDVRADLARRDFTINAIAVPREGAPVDPFGGQQDLENRLIRCVGTPSARFEEDALRMMRALRFSSTLGFTICPDTLCAIHAKSGLAALLAPERVYAELTKLLCGDCAKALAILFSCGLMDRCSRRCCDADFTPLAQLPQDRLLRLAGLCAVLEQNLCCQTEEFLRALRAENAVILACSQGVRAALSGMPDSAPAWKRLVHSIGPAACRCAAAAHYALTGENPLPALADILSGNECCTLAALAVHGREIAALGYTGREIGRTLEALLQHVIEFPYDNQKERLLRLAAQWK